MSLQILRRGAVVLAILFLSHRINAQQITTINFPANNVIYDPYDGMLYASVSGSAGANGNSIVPINPVTGAIGAPVFVGSEPNRMAISDDGHYLYVGLDGAGAVRRFNLLTHQADIQFSLGLHAGCGQDIAGDLRVMPGNPHALAVVKFNSGCSPRSDGVFIYDDGVARPNSAGGSNFPIVYIDTVAFGADASVLYGQDYETTSAEFVVMAVDASGVGISTSTDSASTGLDIFWDNGLIYGAVGYVLDPATITLVGKYSDPNINFFELGRPDSANNRMFLLGDPAYQEISIAAFDQTHLTELGVTNIQGVTGSSRGYPNRGIPIEGLERWGTNGLAFSTGAAVYLFQSPFLSAPQSTTVTLNTDADPVDIGMALKLTATVSAANAPGEVAFREGTTSLGAAKLSNGMAMLSLSGLAVGTHMITAIYSGGGPFSGSTSPALSEVVNPAPSAVSLASSLSPSQPGQNVTLAATVSSSFGIASGMVTFEDFGTSIGSAALNSSGVATLSTTSLSLGPHSLVAIYSGDPVHLRSASKALAQIVKTAQQTTTSIQVAPSANPVIAPLTAPHQVTLTATITPGAGSAGGIVTFYDGVRVLGTAMLDNNAQAELPTTALNVGGNSVTAVYVGDANFSACISAAVGVARSPRPH